MLRTARSQARTPSRSSSRVRPAHASACAFLAALALAAGATACSGGTAAPGALPGSASTGPAPSAADLATERQRADAALDTLLSRYWRADGSFAQSDAPGSGSTPYWTSAQALDSVLDGVERNGPQRYTDVVSAFYKRFDGGGWTSGWFDDEAWMGLAMLRASDVMGDPRYLGRAVFLAEDIAANAQDGSCCGTTPGGLWWDRDHTQKATASNAGAALLAARLAERTGEARWLDFAKATYGWWLANMVDPSGHVADHVTPSGDKVSWTFTYNEGTMIGAAVALHRVTGDARYLADARRMAAFMLSSETKSTGVGSVLFDGASCSGDCEQFKGIGHRFLAELVAEDPGVPGVAALLAADAAAVWTLARSPDTGTFSVDWAGPAAPSATVEAVSSAATALAREAARLR